MIAIFFFALLLHGSHTWILDATPTQLHDGIAQNAKLTCRYDANTTDNTRMKEVTRIRILKAVDDPINPWTTYAKVLDASRPAVLVRPGGNGVTVHGLAGQLAQSYLSVTWQVSSQDTVGTYKCQVDGYTDLDTAVDFSSATVTLEMAGQNGTDIFNVFLYYERRAETMQRESEAIHSKGIALLKNFMKHHGDRSTKRPVTSPTTKTTQLSTTTQPTPQPTTQPTTQSTTQAPRTQWPQGSFALLKADSGCPKSKNGEKWLDGYVRIETESSGGKYPNGNSVSDPNHMSKPVMKREGNSNLFYMNTCRQDNSRATIAPAWPKGKYCIFQGKGGLLSNFKEGWVHFDWEDNGESLYKEHNEPRTDSDGRLYFGCRDDGDPNSPIELPVETPFFMFRRGGQCQEVLNAKVSEESFTVDTEDTGNSDDSKGTVPDVTVNPMHFYLCYYRPIV